MTGGSSTRRGATASTRSGSLSGRGGLTVWYAQDGIVVGALTYEADDDYERAEQLVTEGASIDDV